TGHRRCQSAPVAGEVTASTPGGVDRHGHRIMRVMTGSNLKRSNEQFVKVRSTSFPESNAPADWRGEPARPTECSTISREVLPLQCFHLQRRNPSAESFTVYPSGFGGRAPARSAPGTL